MNRLSPRRFTAPAALFLLALIFGTVVLPPARGFRQESKTPAVDDPWTKDDLIEPEPFSKIVADERASKPEIWYVGPPALYKRSHIPGAKLIGLTSQREGLENLARAAQNTDKAREIVLYCGCCPWNVCPNIRPAFRALRDAGFRHVKLLRLPDSFRQDWVSKNYPVAAGE